MLWNFQVFVDTAFAGFPECNVTKGAHSFWFLVLNVDETCQWIAVEVKFLEVILPDILLLPGCRPPAAKSFKVSFFF